MQKENLLDKDDRVTYSILKKKRADSTEIPNILNIYNDDRIVF